MTNVLQNLLFSSKALAEAKATELSPGYHAQTATEYSPEQVCLPSTANSRTIYSLTRKERTLVSGKTDGLALIDQLPVYHRLPTGQYLNNRFTGDRSDYGRVRLEVLLQSIMECSAFRRHTDCVCDLWRFLLCRFTRRHTSASAHSRVPWWVRPLTWVVCLFLFNLSSSRPCKCDRTYRDGWRSGKNLRIKFSAIQGTHWLRFSTLNDWHNSRCFTADRLIDRLLIALVAI